MIFYSFIKVMPLNNIINLEENFETISPLDQFEVRDLISLDAPIMGNMHLSLSNIGLYLILATFLALNLNILASYFNRIVSNR
jgi:F-type H+-transporting ATPase subunit a